MRMVKARALYDNHSETADELSFLRDDILEIIEKDYDGMEGWWLCGLRGKTGIAPANRLVVITINEVTSDYDLPPTKYGSFAGGKKPLIPSRNAALEDYDTPTSNRFASKQNPNLQSATSSPKGNLFSKEYDDYCVPSNKDNRNSTGGDSSKSLSPQVPSTNFEKYFSSYLKSEKDLSIVITQVTGMMKKWYDTSNYDSRAQIVKVVSVSYWKAIQAYVAEAAKTIASIKGLVKSDTFKSFEEVKRSSSDLENVLDYLNRFHTFTSEEKTKIEFLQKLSSLTSDLCKHSQQMTEFFSKVENEKLWLNVEDLPCPTPVNGRIRDMKAKKNNLETSHQPSRNSFADYDTPSSKSSHVPSDKDLNVPAHSGIAIRDKEKLIPPETPDQRQNISIHSDADGSFETTDYDVPRSSKNFDSRSEIAFVSSDRSRPTSSEFLDYDSPKPKSVLNFLKNKSMESLSSDLSRSSLNDDQMDYDIPSNNSSIIKMRSTPSRGGCVKSLDVNKNLDKSNIFLSFEESDYDIPSNKSEILSNKDESSPQKYLSQMTQSEKNLLKYYFPFVSDELKNLLTLIDSFLNHLKSPSSAKRADSRHSLVFINDVKCLASCSHKILFIIDSILKRVHSNADLNSQLNFSCTKICEHLKNITNLVKQACQPSSSLLEKNLSLAVSEFQLHVHSINKMIRHWK